jgi:hypothetical protein
MPDKATKKSSKRPAKEEEISQVSILLQDFYTKDENSSYKDFYQVYKRRDAVHRGVFEGNTEKLTYGSVYQKWVDQKKGLVEFKLSQITLASKSSFV